MRTFVGKNLEWLDQRTGFVSGTRQFLSRDIPRSVGWAQAFGSVALFLIVLQALTGLLLTFNYAGTPGEAYQSLTYISQHVPAGAFIRGLHHWGASLLLIVVVFHMIQVFLYGAYKRPRELTWISGVCLLLTMLGFGLTGYLLPWDNRAYWGTVVTTQILGSVPLLGGLLQRLLDASDGIGVVTFARFYSLHVLVLPAISLALVALHLFLVHRHGVTPAADDAETGVPFYPGQVFKDLVACFIAFAYLFAAALFLQVPLDRLADATDTTYVPRPEWYFLFLFQLLKIFKGSLEPLGTFVLPTLTVAVLFAIPFVDQRRMKRLRERTAAWAVVVFAMAAWGSLTLSAWSETPRPETPAPAAAVKAGAQVYARYGCVSCHKVDGAGGHIGPPLNGVAQRHSKAWMEEHFAHPQKLSPGTSMPPFQFKGDEQDKLIAYLASLH